MRANVPFATSRPRRFGGEPGSASKSIAGGFTAWASRARTYASTRQRSFRRSAVPDIFIYFIPRYKHIGREVGFEITRTDSIDLDIMFSPFRSR